ncbi:MAG: MBL fold metallo-hydrolase [Acidobacteriota bacterium]|nr:MBL fold metallo-hydrolase [Acidobacteriota bacterium]
MYFKQFELGCLSLYSYMVADPSTGRAVVVDPQRDVGLYLDEARLHGYTIERIIETHFHADFVSGHLELSEATGAVISYGPGAEADFPLEHLSHGQRISLGEVVLEIRATPGHTPESISVVVWERQSDPEPWAVLTGDTLFIGDVGRPDLLAAAGVSPDALARSLYRSLHEQLLTLPDATRVFPAHGAGSACGRAMASAPSSTIGEQRTSNYALAPMSEDAFVADISRYQPTAPAYFGFAASTNRRSHQLLDHDGPTVALTMGDVAQLRQDGAVVIDARTPETFASGHLRGAINVSLDGRFAEYAGDVVAPDRDIVVVSPPGREAEARTRLARIGFDRTVGHLPDILAVLVEHPHEAAVARRIPVTDLAGWVGDDPDVQVVDVRNPGEHRLGVIPGSMLLPLPLLRESLASLDPGRPVVVVCASGQRSSVAASLIRHHGFEQVADVLGGYDAWSAAGLPVAAPA